MNGKATPTWLVGALCGGLTLVGIMLLGLLAQGAGL